MSDINFEQDQEEILDRTSNIDKLANKIKEMQEVQKDIEQNEEYIKHIDESSSLPPLESKNNNNNNRQQNEENLNDYFLTLKTAYLIYKVSFDFL